MQVLASSYSVHVLLPPAMDRRLRQWCAMSPGCDWPRWGGHITLIPAFHLAVPLVRLIAATERSVQSRREFRVVLDEVRSERHITKPGLYLVYLAGRHPTANVELASLRASLAAGLEGLKVDASPLVARHPFVPHISLTLGLPEPEALLLKARAEQDGLHVTFRAKKISLVEQGSEPDGSPRYCLRDFRLRRQG
ncbi:MAG TPA: hypothetical protein DCM14_08760 [Clostridiales bacterium UBA8153]|nr:hypothetical protein [Clostridiales bacterium UBA8153]